MKDASPYAPYNVPLTPCTLKRYQLDPNGRVQIVHPGLTLVSDDVTEMTGNLHPALLTICSISHAEASLQTLSRTIQVQAGPVPKAMLRSLMPLLCWGLLVEVGRTFHLHLHITKSCHNDTRASFALTNGAWQSPSTAEPINHSLIICKVDIKLHRGFLGSDEGSER